MRPVCNPLCPPLLASEWSAADNRSVRQKEEREGLKERALRLMAGAVVAEGAQELRRAPARKETPWR